MNKMQLFVFDASIEVGKNREIKPVNIEPMHANGKHKAAAAAARIIYERFPEAKRVVVTATAL